MSARRELETKTIIQTKLLIVYITAENAADAHLYLTPFHYDAPLHLNHSFKEFSKRVLRYTALNSEMTLEGHLGVVAFLVLLRGPTLAVIHELNSIIISNLLLHHKYF